ncbi:hypothetical protein P4I98_17540 [Bacillus cereus]|nr:hypothetical protein [Bacillus cereus]MDA2233460.1 hypothetical protein [Bacillus cereus]MEB9440030.1 hypothetical protein [Bacillus cereus]
MCTVKRGDFGPASECNAFFSRIPFVNVTKSAAITFNIYYFDMDGFIGCCEFIVL